jgi:hypothetical protein
MYKALLRTLRVNVRFSGIATPRRLLMLFLLASLLLAVPSYLRSLTAAGPDAATDASVLVDPDKAPSELNHHIAGLMLIVIGLMVICGHRFKELAFLRQLWPLLFVLAGIFLAAWSDREIWPRGDLSWSWLLHHDAEARQHKIYAILLIAIGVIEYLRSRAKLSQRWAPWVFPILAIFGGVFLFFHEHGSSESPLGNGNLHAGAVQMHSPEAPRAGAQSSAAITGEHGSEHHQHEHGAAEVSRASLPAGHDVAAHDASNQHAQHHGHQMTAAMLNVRREHMWFAVVGFCVALCKFLYDANPLLRRRFSPYLWANSMILLGLLLVLYTE